MLMNSFVLKGFFPCTVSVSQRHVTQFGRSTFGSSRSQFLFLTVSASFLHRELYIFACVSLDLVPCIALLYKPQYFSKTLASASSGAFS